MALGPHQALALGLAGAGRGDVRRLRSPVHPSSESVPARATHQDVLARLPRPRDVARLVEIRRTVYVASTSTARARGNASKRKAYSLMSACSPSMRVSSMA